VRGLRARGGFTVSIFWQNGHLSSAIVKADREADLTVRYQSGNARIHLRARVEHAIPVAMLRKQEAG